MGRPSVLSPLSRGRLSGFRARPFGAGLRMTGAAGQSSDPSAHLQPAPSVQLPPAQPTTSPHPNVPSLASPPDGALPGEAAGAEAVVQVLLGRLGEYDAASLRHSFRVARLACALGRALDLPTREARHLRWGALLHDIGKLFVPHDVLNKPAPLTPQERVWVDLHGREGSALLAGYAALPPAVAEIARHHHDAWPGAGEAGDPAPGTSQLVGIVAVADVYDALVSQRPYKPAWSAGDAVRELRRQAGHRLGPHLVAAFEEMLEREGQTPRSSRQETC